MMLEKRQLWSLLIPSHLTCLRICMAQSLKVENLLLQWYFLSCHEIWDGASKLLSCTHEWQISQTCPLVQDCVWPPSEWCDCRDFEMVCVKLSVMGCEWRDSLFLCLSLAVKSVPWGETRTVLQLLQACCLLTDWAQKAADEAPSLLFFFLSFLFSFCLSTDIKPFYPLICSSSLPISMIF